MRNFTFDEIELGKPLNVERTLSGADVESLRAFAGAEGA
jgi:hypothetical protein